MSFVLEKFDEWAEDENEELKDVFKQYYGPLLQLSSLFPYWERSMIAISISFLVFHSTMLISHIFLLLITTVFNLYEGDLELASVTFHYALLFFFGFFVLGFVNYQRKIYAQQHGKLSSEVGVYKSGKLYEEKWVLEAKKQFRKETLYYLAVPVVISIAGFLILTIPYVAKWVKGMENPYTANGVNQNLPFPCWYPFSTHEGFPHFMALMFQALAATSLSSIIVAGLLLFSHFTQQLRFELRVIGYGLRTLLSRAQRLYHAMHPNTRGIKVENFNPEYQRIVGICLRDTVIHHQTVTEMMGTYEEEVGLPAGVSYGIGTVVIGMSLFNILEGLKMENYESVILFAMFIACETLCIFILSWLGELITTESINLRNEVYFMEWYKMDVSNRKVLLNFQTVITEPYILKAAGLVDMSMESFSSIMNAAYSFFNVMNAN